MYGRLSQLLKLYARQRDKQQIMSLVFEGVTSSLLRDMITILYEPLAKVYKTANVYNSVSDFKEFMDDLIDVVQKAEEQGKKTLRPPRNTHLTFFRSFHRFEYPRSIVH